VLPSSTIVPELPSSHHFQPSLPRSHHHRPRCLAATTTDRRCLAATTTDRAAQQPPPPTVLPTSHHPRPCCLPATTSDRAASQPPPLPVANRYSGAYMKPSVFRVHISSPTLRSAVCLLHSPCLLTHHDHDYTIHAPINSHSQTLLRSLVLLRFLLRWTTAS
jgi:hypothetical protein